MVDARVVGKHVQLLHNEEVRSEGTRLLHVLNEEDLAGCALSQFPNLAPLYEVTLNFLCECRVDSLTQDGLLSSKYIIEGGAFTATGRAPAASMWIFLLLIMFGRVILVITGSTGTGRGGCPH